MNFDRFEIFQFRHIDFSNSQSPKKNIKSFDDQNLYIIWIKYYPIIDTKYYTYIAIIILIIIVTSIIIISSHKNCFIFYFRFLRIQKIQFS